MMTREQLIQQDKGKWEELRHLWYGRHQVVMDSFYAKNWPNSWKQGTITPVYAHVLRWGAKWLAPSTTWPWSCSAQDDGVAAILRSWVPALRTARAIQRLAGQAWVHLALREGLPIVDMVWGDMLDVTVNARFPNHIQSCKSIRLSLASGYVEYSRTADGLVEAVLWPDPQIGGPAEVIRYAGGLPEYPLIGWYRDDIDHVMPGLSQVWLQHQKTVNEQLTDIEHTRRYLPGQDIIKTDAREALECQELPRGQDKIIRLNQDEDYQRIASTGTQSESLNSVKTYLKLMALLEGLPPDIIDIESYAQTGAAKAIDAAPSWDIVMQDYKQTQEQVDALVLQFAPYLEYWAYNTAGMKIELPKPRPPAIGDPLHREQAADARWARGVESPLDQILVEHPDWSEEQAEEYWRRNMQLREEVNGNSSSASKVGQVGTIAKSIEGRDSAMDGEGISDMVATDKG